MWGSCNVTGMEELASNQKPYFILFFGLFSFVATIMNVIVIYLFIMQKSLRTSSNKFIVSLAVGDLLMGLLLGPANILQICSIYGCFLQTVANLVSSTMAVSGVTIGCIAYDRYLYVKSVSRYNSKSMRRVVSVMIVLPWFMPVVLIASKLSSEIGNAVIVISLIFTIYAFLSFSYVKLIQLLRTSLKHSKQANMRNAKMVTFIKWVFMFAIIFTLPIVVNRSMQIKYLITNRNWLLYKQNKTFFKSLAQCLFILNSCVNPILYCWKHQAFRKAFNRTFFKRRVPRVRFLRVAKVYPLNIKNNALKMDANGGIAGEGVSGHRLVPIKDGANRSEVVITK